MSGAGGEAVLLWGVMGLAGAWQIWSGQPVAWLLLFVLVPFALLLLAADWLRGEKRRAKERGKRAALLVVFGGMSFGLFMANRVIAKDRAEALIVAIRTYRAENGVYPQTLQALQPRYVPSIQAAAPMRVMQREFSYSLSKESLEDPHLRWVDLPPFGRPYYAFETGRWGYLD